jgi:hypothetical protein
MTVYTAAASERASSWERLMIAGGVVAGALFIMSMALFIGVTAPGMPPMEASAVVKAAFYAEQARSPIYSLVRLLIFFQLAPLVLFLGGLYATLRRVEGGDGSLANAIFAAGLLGALFAPLAELVEGHLLLGLAAAGADPVVTVGFDGMTPVAFGLSGILQLVVLAGSGLLLREGGLVPRWISWLGYAVAAIGLLGAGVIVMQQLFFFGLLSAILYKVWMIALAVALLRRRQPSARAVPGLAG